MTSELGNQQILQPLSDNAGVQSNNPLSVRTCERPLCLQFGLQQFKFHILLEYNEYRMTTLRSHPLQFIIKTSDIVTNNGACFKNPLQRHIFDIVLKCKRLGDGGKITVQVPVDHATRNVAWGSKNYAIENATLWVRVFEVGSGRVAEAKAVKDSIDIAKKHYAYWLRLSGAIRSDPIVLQSFDSDLKEAVARFNKELAKAKEKLAKAYITWMECRPMVTESLGTVRVFGL